MLLAKFIFHNNIINNNILTLNANSEYVWSWKIRDRMSKIFSVGKYHMVAQPKTAKPASNFTLHI